MGPYTEYRARQLADKIESKHEIYRTATHDPVKAKRIIKAKVIEEHGYEIGAKRLSSKNPISSEAEPEVA